MQTSRIVAGPVVSSVARRGGEWTTNEKTLLDRAGLRGIDRVVTAVNADLAGLEAACDTVEALCTDAMVAATARRG